MKTRDLIIPLVAVLLLYGAIGTTVTQHTEHTSSIILKSPLEPNTIQENPITPIPAGTNEPQNLVEVKIKHLQGRTKPTIEIQDGKKEYYFEAGAGITVGTFNPTLITSTSGDLLLPRWSFYRVTIHDGPSENDPSLIDGSMPAWTLVSSERGYKITSNIRPLIENDGPNTNRILGVSVSAFGGLHPFKNTARYLPGFNEDSKTWQITVYFT